MKIRKQVRKISDRQRRSRYARRKALGIAAILLAVAAMVAADRYGIFGRPATPDRETYHGRTFRVTRVIDGDTIDIDIPDGRWPTTRLRLWGIDTPETVKPNWPVEHFGPEASAFTKRMVEGKRVRIELEPGTPTRGKHGRLLAWVFLPQPQPDGRLLNRLIIAQGYGYADPRFFDHHLKRELLTLQSRARSSGAGLWKAVKPTDLPSYYQRGRHKLTLPEVR